MLTLLKPCERCACRPRRRRPLEEAGVLQALQAHWRPVSLPRHRWLLGHVRGKRYRKSGLPVCQLQRRCVLVDQCVFAVEVVAVRKNLLDVRPEVGEGSVGAAQKLAIDLVETDRAVPRLSLGSVVFCGTAPARPKLRRSRGSPGRQGMAGSRQHLGTRCGRAGPKTLRRGRRPRRPSSPSAWP